MDAEKYLKERTRMAGVCSCKDCEDCVLNNTNNGRDLDCTDLERKYPKVAIALVENWAKEHPVKTYKSVFLEKFPDAETDYDGELFACVRHVFGSEHAFHGDCDDETACEVCWNREVEE